MTAWATANAVAHPTIVADCSAHQRRCELPQVVADEVDVGGGVAFVVGQRVGIERAADLGASFARDLLDQARVGHVFQEHRRHLLLPDRKSTRLNSSHSSISYAVFCLKKKKKHKHKDCITQKKITKHIAKTT